MSPELEKIKKKYGEKFAHLCRKNFPIILDTEGKLLEILETKFAETKNLYEDLIDNNLEIEFKNYIYEIYHNEKEEIQREEQKTPYEILDEAGYDLIECNTEDEIQSFKKWYDPNEVICTIYNGGRLDNSVVFFAVKKNATEIKREDFTNPKREDEYGTSVLGIQFDKYGFCTPHIISRYNHSVSNPNATYGNQLDKIAPGLNESFRCLLQERGLDLNSSNITDFEIPGYTVAGDGKYYRYNMEVNGIYYCENNVILDHGKIKKFDKEKYLVIDYFIVDLQSKKITTYDKTIVDSFTDEFKNIEKISVQKCKNENEKDKRVISISCEGKKDVTIKIDKSNNIIGYENENVTCVRNEFLSNNLCLAELKLPQLQSTGDNFLWSNKFLTGLNLPQLQTVGDDFLLCNGFLKKLSLPKLQTAGDEFLHSNRSLTELSLPKLQTVGDYFLMCNKFLTQVNLPQIQSVGNNFLNSNEALAELSLPQLQTVGDYFLMCNKFLTQVNLPQIQSVGNEFLLCNGFLKKLSLPKLQSAGDSFLHYNRGLVELNLPQLQTAGHKFLHSNKSLTELSLPQLQTVGNSFLWNNEFLEKLNLPQIQSAGNDFLWSNKFLTELNLPQLQTVGDNFLYWNESLTKDNLPLLSKNNRQEVSQQEDYQLLTKEPKKKITLIQAIKNALKRTTSDKVREVDSVEKRELNLENIKEEK